MAATSVKTHRRTDNYPKYHWAVLMKHPEKVELALRSGKIVVGALQIADGW